MKKILLIENFTEDFIRYRIPYVNYLELNGYEVYIMTPNEGLIIPHKRVHHYNLNRNNKNPFQLLNAAFFTRRIMIDNKINICHSFRLLPNIINIIANCCSSRNSVIHITGLGSLFDKKSKYRWGARFIYKLLIKYSFKTVVQNKFDTQQIYKGRYSPNNIVEIHGSGVDCDKFSLSEIKEKHEHQMKFLFVGRLIDKKGIRKIIEIFKKIDNATLNIVGWIDNKNPDSINAKYLESLPRNISFHGKTNNVLKFYETNDIFLYPSDYNEGIPRVLLEAISCGMPIITSKGNGCEHCVSNNGILVNPRSKRDIHNAICKMIEINPAEFRSFSLNSRKLALNEFSQDIIFEKWLELYKI